MKTTQVNHVNQVGSWETKSQRQIFCKLKQTVGDADTFPCDSCPHFVGWGVGDAIECRWQDTPTLGGGINKLIPPGEGNSEFMRVSKLIDKGILKKG